MKRIYLLPILFTSLMIVLDCQSNKLVYPTWIQQHRDKRTAHFEQENKELTETNYVILLGNSLTEGFSVATYFADKPVLNRGIVADHTGIEGNGILQRLQASVFECRPAKVFLMIGINDLADRIFTPRQIAYGVKLIIQKIQNFNPQIKIYLQSTLPTSGKYAHLKSLVLRYNRLLEQTAAELPACYINLHPHFTNEIGELRSEYSRDGLHLTDTGYQTWYQLIHAYL